MDSKQRAALRAKAGTLTSVFQIGKDGISDGVIEAVDTALEARELIKITVLKTCDIPPSEAVRDLAAKTKAEPVASIGGKIILYRYNPKLKTHII